MADVSMSLLCHDEFRPSTLFSTSLETELKSLLNPLSHGDPGLFAELAQTAVNVI
jgi:hypothetical protein